MIFDPESYFTALRSAAVLTMVTSRTKRTALTIGLQAVFLCNPSYGQTPITVGNGTILNGTFQAPSPYSNSQPGARHQFLFLASELVAAGMTQGTISGIGFNVAQQSFATLEGFTIQIGTTANNALTGTWEQDLGVAWGPTDFTDQVGWSEHAFSSPFEWDGASNIVIETCYANFNTAQNAQVFQSSTPFTSCVSRNSPNPAICTDPFGTHVLWQQRPNVRFTWSALEGPPVAVPMANRTFTCTGAVSFTDHSLNAPTSWTWDFGDGNFSIEQNVDHTYTESGTYTVVLVVENDFGSSEAQLTITVDLSGTTPIVACEAPSTGDVEEVGILSVTIQDVTTASGDAVSEGYADNTCQSVTILQGTQLDLSVVTPAIPSHAIRAWVDWDNSGTFTENESILTGTGPDFSSSTLVPGNAVLETPLRLRVVAAYDLITPEPQACGPVQYGQAEDYSITVLANTQPPQAIFSASPTFGCNGAVQFTDASLNTPTAWAWDFGDDGTSGEQDPEHTYAESGTYTVMLTAINANGQDDTVAVDLITIDLESQLVPATCTPNTVAFCCGYGILGFEFAGISSESPNGSEGYQDRSCGNVAEIQVGQSYAWSVVTGDETPHDTRIWVDLDNDGAFTANELLATALDQSSPNGVVMIPTGEVFGQPVRLRVQCDVIGHSSAPCDEPLYGQVEDFSAVISPSTDPPVAAFTATPLVTCDGVVNFTDLSTNGPTSWSWNFGDGGTSDEQDPEHVYVEPGTYNVTLTATNEFGSDAAQEFNYIRRVQPWQCDTLRVNSSDDLSSTECLGILSDDGGPNGNYLQGESGAFTISPAGAEVVHLQFSVFQWGNSPNRHLAIYDGPDVNSPLIDEYNGNGLNQLPGNGSITSSGPSITLRQEQDGGGPPPNSAGFLLTWNCSFTGIRATAESPLQRIRPQPADEWFAVDLVPDPGKERRLVVRNAIGQIVQEHLVPGSATSFRIDSAALPAGIYAVQLMQGSGQWGYTLIIQ
ncbi:MAG: PKD domain-containing protein [Flavobacteriales bacterium]|nr:PKD domain-containing protein [Flavobacteriales bacterium]